MKFIHAADLHLDSALIGLEQYEGAPIDEIRLATRRALENLVAAAIEQQVQFVLLAGDLYDGDWKDYNTGQFFVRQMLRLHEAGIPVVQISGNHDAQNKMTRALRLPPNVRTLGHKEAETVLGETLHAGLDEVAFHGQSFATAAVVENMVRAYPAAVPGRFNIGLLHTSLTGADGEHARYAPCTLADLETKGYQYWALGHIHKRAVVSERPPVVFPGNLQGRHIRETGAKGAMLVSTNSRGEAKLEFLPLDVFRWELCSISASEAADETALLQSVHGALAALQAQAEGRPLAVRVELTGRTELHQSLAGHLERVTAEIRNTALQLGGAGVWVEKVKVRTQPPQAELDLQDGPLGELHDYLQELMTDDAALGELAGVLADLGQRLPDELKTGPSGVAVGDRAWLRERLAEVEPLLRERLLATEGAS